jgi:hypothetical protein
VKIVCRVKFRAFGITFGQFERIIPIDGEVWRFVKEHVVRPILQRLAHEVLPPLVNGISRPMAVADGVLAAVPPPSHLPTGIKCVLIDERGIYLALE